MSTKAFAIGVVGAGCIMAAGVGGFLAQRVSQAEDALAAAGAAAESTPGTPTGSAPLAAAERAVPRPTTPQLPDAAPAHVESASPPPPDEATAADPPGELPAPLPPVVTSPASLPAETGPEAVLAPPPPPIPESLPEPVTPSAPERPDLIELTIEEGSVIGIRLDAEVTTKTAEVEDRILATVTRDVEIDGRTAIPMGARLEGVITLVEAGGRFRERARIGVQFTRLQLTENTEQRIQTAPIYRQGESPVGEATSKIGASAVVGAILGGLIGGKKGATIGGAAGAAGGTAAVARGDRNDVTLEEGTPLTVRLTEPLVLLVERREQNR